MAGPGPELELGTGERISVTESLVLGRSTEADVVLADPEASVVPVQLQIRRRVRHLEWPGERSQVATLRRQGDDVDEVSFAPSG